MRFNTLSTMALVCIAATTPIFSSAATFCKYRSAARTHELAVVTDGAACPVGTVKLEQIPSLFGTGSAGAFSASGRVSLRGAARGFNYNFTNFTVRQGAELTVPSGTVIRCTGAFENNGTISVTNNASAARRHYSSPTVTHPSERPAAPSYFGGISESGAVTSSVDTIAGGASALPRTTLSTYKITTPGLVGGGGGGAALETAGAGGGIIFILCKGSVTNNGIIQASGDAASSGDIAGGGGGGAGGIVVIASARQIENTGSIYAYGEQGGDSLQNVNYAVAPGGGGAGGVIELVAPRISAGEGLTVSGGRAGELITSSVNGAAVKMSGGAGGSLVSRGGAGGSITDGTTIGAAADGEDGATILIQADPVQILGDSAP